MNSELAEDVESNPASIYTNIHVVFLRHGVSHGVSQGLSGLPLCLGLHMILHQGLEFD